MTVTRSTQVGGFKNSSISARADLLIGTILADRYTVQRYLGRGAFGNVYQCSDSLLADLPVAVKLFQRAFIEQPNQPLRLHREMLACQKVNHPNVAAFYDCIQTEHFVGYSMELVDGKPFDEILYNSPNMSISELLRIYKQFLRGLEAIHGAGIVHRDVKPSNILLTSLNEVKISDFGIANQQLVEIEDQHSEAVIASYIEQNSSVENSMNGRIIGTPLYLAPEYISNGKFDKRSDLYAAGAILYELLAEQAPYDESNLPKLLLKKVDSDPIAAHEINTKCPKPLSDLISKMLARNPEDRPASAADIERQIIKIEQRLEKDGARSSGEMKRPLRGNLFDTQIRENNNPSVISPLVERPARLRNGKQEAFSNVKHAHLVESPAEKYYRNLTESEWHSPTYTVFRIILLTSISIIVLLAIQLIYEARPGSQVAVPTPKEVPLELNTIEIQRQVSLPTFENKGTRYHAPLESNSDVIRTMDDAKRVREERELQEAMTKIEAETLEKQRINLESAFWFNAEKQELEVFVQNLEE